MAPLGGHGPCDTRDRRADVRADTPDATLPEQYLDTAAFAEAKARAHRSGLAPMTLRVWSGLPRSTPPQSNKPRPPPALPGPAEQPAHTLAL